MTGIKELTGLMLELEDMVSACARCGACQAVCPLFRETGREADVARGKLVLLENLMQDVFNDPNGVSKRLDRCLLCGSCELNCSSSVSALEIFIKARAIITGYTGLSWIKKAVFRLVLARPAVFDWIMETVVTFQGLFIKPVNNRTDTSQPRFLSPLITDRHFKTLAREPFHSKSGLINTPPGASGIKAAFFTGCLVDKFYPDIAGAAINVLKHHDIGMFMPDGQGCCGIPAVAAGDIETFNTLVAYAMEQFEKEKVDYMVTACSTCAYTIKKIWPMMFKDETIVLKGQVEAFAEKTLDISRFLVDVVGIKDQTGENRDDTAVLVTYHDPCHLKKSLGVYGDPRALIKASTGYVLREMTEPDMCCGMGGSFNLRHYEISAEIGKRKIEDIRETGCSVIATSCPACMMQLSDMLSRAGEDAAVKHVIDLYAEGIYQ